jgi:hypothetical protein
VVPWIFVAVLPFLSNAFSKGGKLDFAEIQHILMLLPGIVAMYAMYQRSVRMATQLCLPVARRDYLKQLGAATALLYVEVWCILSAPVVLWCMFANPRPDFVEVGRMLAVSLLLLVWFFGVGVWFARFRSPTSVSPLSAVGLLLLLVILGVLYLVQSRSFQVPGAVAAAGVGVLLAGDAYRRWLITDLD